MDSAKLYSYGDKPDSPIILVGQRQQFRAQLWLENDSDKELHLRKALLASRLVRVVDGEDRMTNIPVPAVLAARHRTTLTVAFAVDSWTLPGEYEAVIRLESASGTQEFPVRVHVPQSYAISIEPDQFVLAAAAGNTIADQVLVVHNQGNTPVLVTSIGEYPLRKPPWAGFLVGPVFRYALGEHNPSRQAEVAKEVATEREHDCGSILVENEETTVAPGTWASVRFAVKLSEAVPCGALLRATPRVGTERFSIDIVTPPKHEHRAAKDDPGNRQKQQRKRD
jgi:hypothetical protein